MIFQTEDFFFLDEFGLTSCKANQQKNFKACKWHMYTAPLFTVFDGINLLEII